MENSFMKSTLLSVIFLLFLTLQSVSAQPQVLEGDQISPLSLVDKDGTIQNFDSIKGENGAVLVFIRSAEWCPYCQRQLVDLNEFYQDIENTNYELVSISYDAVDVLKKFSDKHNIQFNMLSDDDSSIIKAFGILNTDMKPGSKAYGIPNPAIYIVSNEGAVQGVLSEEGYKKRPSSEVLLEAIKTINSTGK
jgi:peroxiredoxin